MCVATTDGWTEATNHDGRRTRDLRGKRRPVRTVHCTRDRRGVELPPEYGEEQDGGFGVYWRLRHEEGERKRACVLAAL